VSSLVWAASHCAIQAVSVWHACVHAVCLLFALLAQVIASVAQPGGAGHEAPPPVPLSIA
jgi:hypothetical protein